MQAKNTISDFWARMSENAQNGCWEWTKGRQPFGYGRFWYKGKGYDAHRLSWILTYGPIPKGLFVLHSCDNPPCSRPDHLFLGTHADNMADMARKGRTRAPKGDKHGSHVHPETVTRGEKNGQAVLTEADVRRIRACDTKRWGAKTRLAEEYGVSPASITHILKRVSWKHIE